MKRKNVAMILKKAEMISKAIEDESEEILEDTEAAVKSSVPACNLRKVLVAIENKLEKEGVEALFEKKVAKIAMIKSASESLSDEEIDEIAEKITDAIVEEFEDVLKDADEVCDDEIAKLKDEDAAEVEGKLKGILEKKLAAKGIYAGLERKIAKTSTAKVAKVVKKDTAVNKALNMLHKNRSNRK